MVQTLRYIRDYVIPAVGPVEPVSVYRNPALNVCAGGAPESAHKLDSAIDMVPLRPTDRASDDADACAAIHSEHGAAYNAGPRLLRLSAVPHRQHQIPALEHGPGGRRGMPADRPSRGYRERRPAAAVDGTGRPADGRPAPQASAGDPALPRSLGPHRRNSRQPP